MTSTQFEGLLTTLLGYIIIAFSLACLHYLMSVLRLRKYVTLIDNRISISRHHIEVFLHWEKCHTFYGGNMADISKDGLLLGGGICHITTTSVFMHESKQVPACIRNIVNTFTFGNISSACTKAYFNCCNVLRIATLCNIAQRRQDFGHPTFAAFVDLRAAFDSLSRPSLWLLLTRFVIPDKI